jgi:hypothetical protein
MKKPKCKPFKKGDMPNIYVLIPGNLIPIEDFKTSCELAIKESKKGNRKRCKEIMHVLNLTFK